MQRWHFRRWNRRAEKTRPGVCLSGFAFQVAAKLGIEFNILMGYTLPLMACSAAPNMTRF
jgi:hypothetical protein